MEEDARVGLYENENPWSRFEAEYYPRLLYFAKRKISGFESRRYPIPSDCTPKDCVHEAVRKVIDGTRPWKPHRCSLLQHLFGAVQSEVSNRITSHGNLRVRGLNGDVSALMPATLLNLTPEEVLKQKEELDRLLRHLAAIDELLKQLAEYLWFSPIDGDALYAERLGLTTQELFNLKKRLMRAVRAFDNDEAHADDKPKAQSRYRASGRDRCRDGERPVPYQN